MYYSGLIKSPTAELVRGRAYSHQVITKKEEGFKMLQSKMQMTDNNIRNPSMSVETDEINRLTQALAQTNKQLQIQQASITAIDMGICSLIAAIAETQPSTATAITMQLAHVAEQLPHHLKENAQPATDFFEKWQRIAKSNPNPETKN